MNFAKAAYIISLLSQLASVANGAGLRAPVKKLADTTASDASQTSNELSLDDTHFNLNDYDPEVYSELFHPLYKTFHNLTLAEQDAILDERDRNVKGYHRGLMVEHDHSFKESECNFNVENEPCMSFDDFMLSQVSNDHRHVVDMSSLILGVMCEFDWLRTSTNYYYQPSLFIITTTPLSRMRRTQRSRSRVACALVWIRRLDLSSICPTALISSGSSTSRTMHPSNYVLSTFLCRVFFESILLP